MPVHKFQLPPDLSGTTGTGEALFGEARRGPGGVLRLGSFREGCAAVPLLLPPGASLTSTQDNLGSTSRRRRYEDDDREA